MLGIYLPNREDVTRIPSCQEEQLLTTKHRAAFNATQKVAAAASLGACRCRKTVRISLTN